LSLRMEKLEFLIENKPKPIVRYGISNKTTFNILHISNMDGYSPSKTALQGCANNIGITLNITENRGSNFNDIDTTGIDAILVSVWSSVDKNNLGNFLDENIKKGVNIVIVLFSNSNGFTIPLGSFQSPLEVLRDDNNHQEYTVIMNNHPLFSGNPTINAGSDKRRAILKLVENGNMDVDVVAEWNDKVPMIGVRKDLNALVTTLGFQCGSVGSQNGIRVVINALAMIKL
jgi:hypothetical protein